MRRSAEDFRIGWICLFESHRSIAKALFDEVFPDYEAPQIDDGNIYEFGRMSSHNIVIACPSALSGEGLEAKMARDLERSFPSIRFLLLVGVGGAAPRQDKDIRLGDVVVSAPTAPLYKSVTCYDLGKYLRNNDLQPTESFEAPPKVLLTAISRLKAKHKQKGNTTANIVRKMAASNFSSSTAFQHPPLEMDRLYQSGYTHQNDECPCLDKGPDRRRIGEVKRPRKRPDCEGGPSIFYGLIASSNMVIRDARVRDEISSQNGALCFALDAAGIADELSCVVIRGIGDYCDTHKNAHWLTYAAATASAYAKDLLGVIPGSKDDSKGGFIVN